MHTYLSLTVCGQLKDHLQEIGRHLAHRLPGWSGGHETPDTHTHSFNRYWSRGAPRNRAWLSHGELTRATRLDERPSRSSSFCASYLPNRQPRLGAFSSSWRRRPG